MMVKGRGITAAKHGRWIRRPQPGQDPAIEFETVPTAGLVRVLGGLRVAMRDARENRQWDELLRHLDRFMMVSNLLLDRSGILAKSSEKGNYQKLRAG